MKKNKIKINFNNFYPFTRKNKAISIIKKSIGIIAAISLVVYFFTNIISLSLIENKEFGEKFLLFFKKSLLLIYPFCYLVFIIIAFKKETSEAKKYSVSTWYGVLVIVYNMYFGIRTIFFLKDLTSAHAKINSDNSLFLNLQIMNGFVVSLAFILIALEVALFFLRPKMSQYKTHLINTQIEKEGKKNSGKKIKVN